MRDPLMDVKETLRELSADELRELARTLGLDAPDGTTRATVARRLTALLERDSKAKRAFLAYAATLGTCRTNGGMADERPSQELGRLLAKERRRAKRLDELLARERRATDGIRRKLEEARGEQGRLSEVVGSLRSTCEKATGDLSAARRRIAFLEEELERRALPPPDTSDVLRLSDEVDELRATVEELRKEKRHSARLAHKKPRKVEDGASRLSEEVRRLREKKEALEAEVPSGMAYAGRFVRTSRGGVVVAPGREPLTVPEGQRKRLVLLDDEEVVVTHRRQPKKGVEVRSVDSRPRREIYGEVSEEGEPHVVVDGDRCYLAPCRAAQPGAMVKAVAFEGGLAEVERVLKEADMVRLISQGRSGPRRPRTREPRRRKRTSRERSLVLIVGGDRVGSGYVEALSARGIGAEWVSGFAGLLKLREGLGSSRAIVLILSQVSHTVARAVSKAAHEAGCPLVKTTSRGRTKVAQLVEMELRKRGLLPDEQREASRS